MQINEKWWNESGQNNAQLQVVIQYDRERRWEEEEWEVTAVT